MNILYIDAGGGLGGVLAALADVGRRQFSAVALGDQRIRELSLLSDLVVLDVAAVVTASSAERAKLRNALADADLPLLLVGLARADMLAGDQALGWCGTRIEEGQVRHVQCALHALALQLASDSGARQAPGAASGHSSFVFQGK